jgi:hypothetical protein
VICVSESTVKLANPMWLVKLTNCSNKTAVVPVKPVPVIVIVLPPAVGPEAGEIPVISVPGRKVNWSAGVTALVPSGVTTVTSTVPSAWEAVVVVISVSETTVKTKSGSAESKSTSVALVKPVPVIVTRWPPRSIPRAGLTLVTVGASAALAAWLATADSPSVHSTAAVATTMTRDKSPRLGAPGLPLCPARGFPAIDPSVPA